MRRIIGIDLKLEQNISIAQVFAPQQGRPVIEKEEFYRQLQDVLNNSKYKENIIMCGDWNGHIGTDRLNYEEIIGAHSIGNRNEDGKRILDFAIVNSLSVMNTFFQHRPSHKFTWYRWNNRETAYTQKSMIDLFLTNNKSLFNDVKAVPSVSLDADHRMVIAKINIKIPICRARTGRRQFKLPKLSEEGIVARLREKLGEVFQDHSGETNIDNQWCEFKDNVTAATSEILGEKVPYKGKKKTTAWWTDEVRDAVGNKMKRFRRWMKTRQLEDHRNYVEARKTAEHVKRRAKIDSWEKIGNDLKADMEGSKKLLYGLTRSYRGKNNEMTYAVKNKNGELLTQPERIAERWMEYFSELLNVQGSEDEGREVEILEDETDNTEDYPNNYG